MHKILNLTALLLALSPLATGQEKMGADISQTDINILLIGFAVIVIVPMFAIAIMCARMMKINSLLLELREKLTFSASTADNGKATTDAIQKLDAQVDSLRKDIATLKNTAKAHAAETPYPSAEELAAKVTASKPFADMAASIAKCYAELNRLSKEVDDKCSVAIPNATSTFKQTSEEINALSQKLNSVEESIANVPAKAHSLVESELDKAKEFFANALKRIEDASASIATIESQLSCLQELTTTVSKFKEALGQSEERNAALAANVTTVEEGLADMAVGLAQFREFSAQLPPAATAKSDLAAARDLLKSKTDELEATARQLSDLKAKAETDGAKLKTLEAEKQELLAQSEKIMRTLEASQKRLEETVALAESRDNEYNALKGQYDGISKRLEILDIKKREAESANATLKEQNASLTAELDAAKHQARDATASLNEIKPAYDAMLTDRAGLYPQGLDAEPYKAALQELERLAQNGSINAELCLRDLAMINIFLKQNGNVAKDAQEQMLRVLWYFSKNFTAAMKAAAISPAESYDRLNVWLTFFLEMKDEGFALEMPSIGDGVTLSWMSPSVPGTNTVSAVEAWAVYAGGNSSPTFKALIR